MKFEVDVTNGEDLLIYVEIVNARNETDAVIKVLSKGIILNSGDVVKVERVL